MSPSPAPAVDSSGYFQEHGFYYLDDPTVGRTVKTVDDQGQSTSLSSWKDFKDVAEGNAEIRNILGPFLAQPNPRRCYTFGPEPGQAFCFWPQEDQAHHRLVVSMWSAGTKLVLHDGSHTGPLKAVFASNGLFEVHPASLKNRGCKAVAVNMDEGGIVILDIRFTFQREAGFTIAYGMDVEAHAQGDAS